MADQKVERLRPTVKADSMVRLQVPAVIRRQLNIKQGAKFEVMALNSGDLIFKRV